MRNVIHGVLATLLITSCSRPTETRNAVQVASAISTSAFYEGEKAPSHFMRAAPAVTTPRLALGGGELGTVGGGGGNGNGDGGVIGGSTPTPVAVAVATTPAPTIAPTPVPTPNGNGNGNGNGNPTTSTPTATPTPALATPTPSPTPAPTPTTTTDGGHVGGNPPGGSDGGQCSLSDADLQTLLDLEVRVANVCTWHYEPLFFPDARRPLLTLETFPLYLDDGLLDRCVATSPAMSATRPIYAMTNEMSGDYMNSTDPTEASPSYTPRGLAFYVYTQPVAENGCDLPLYRCWNGGYHYQTNSPSCEMGGVLDGPLGYVCRTQVPGTTPLYRLRANYGAFYSVNDDADAQAHFTWGWGMQAVTGFAPADPQGSQNGLVLARRDMSGYDFGNGTYQSRLSVDLAPLKRAFPTKWRQRPMRARICDDAAGAGTCNYSDRYTTASIADLYLVADHMPSALNLEVFGTRIAYNHDYYTNLPGFCERLVSPLVMSLGGGPIRLSGPRGGVMFDLYATGTPVATGWTADGTSAFLVRDLNHDGRIDSGAELFGSATRLPDGSTATNGFEALNALDSDGDGFFTPNDRAWGEVMLWADRNHNGLSEASELMTLESASVTRIDLHYVGMSEVDGFGNKTMQRSTVTRAGAGLPGLSLIVDIWFNTLIGE